MCYRQYISLAWIRLVDMQIVLVRHAESTANAAGILAGRAPDVALSNNGEQQSLALRETFHDLDFDAVISSPISRCLQTARIAFPQIDQPIIDNRFIEMDFGDWTGKSLKELSNLAEWKAVQNSPAEFRFPKGESFVELRTRVASGLTNVINEYASVQRIFIFTHADVIKMGISWLLDSPLNRFQRISIDPASVSILNQNESDLMVRSVNLDARSERIQQVLRNEHS